MNKNVLLTTILLLTIFIVPTATAIPDHVYDRVPDHVVENVFSEISFPEHIKVNNIPTENIRMGKGYVSVKNVTLNEDNSTNYTATVTFKDLTPNTTYKIMYSDQPDRKRGEVQETGQTKGNYRTDETGTLTFTTTHFSTWTATPSNVVFELNNAESNTKNLHTFMDVPNDFVTIDISADSSLGVGNDFTLSANRITDDTVCNSYQGTDIFSEICVTDTAGVLEVEFYNSINTDSPHGMSPQEQTITYSLTNNAGFPNEDTVTFDLTIQDTSTGGGSGTGLDSAEAYYALDTGSGTTAVDSSVNGNDGTVNGATWTTTANAKLGNSALNLDGTDDYVDTGVTQGDSDFTIGGWFNADTITDTGLFNNIVNDGSRDGFQVNLRSDIGWRMVFFDSGSVTLGPNSGSAVASTGTWYHVVLTYDSSTNDATLYVNGVEELTGNGGLGASTDNIRFGSLYHGSSFWDGRIDETFFYTRVLNSTERSDLYNSGTGFNPYSVTPFEQTTTIPTQNLLLQSGSGSQTRDFIELFYSDYFTGYDAGDDLILDWVNADGTAQQEIVTIQNNTEYNFNVNSTPDKTVIYADEDRLLVITPQKGEMYPNWNNEFSYQFGLRITNGTDTIGNDFVVTAEYYSEQVASILNNNMNIDDTSSTVNLNDYFNYVSEYEVNFNHDGASRILTVPAGTSGVDTYTSTDFGVTLDSTGLLTFTDNNVIVNDIVFTVTAYGVTDQGLVISDNQNVQDSFIFSVEQDPLQQITTPSFNQDLNTQETYTISDYFSNADDYSIQLEYDNALYGVDSTNTQIDTGIFTITYINSNEFVIYSGLTELNTTIDITAEQTITGDTITTQADLNIALLSPVQQVASIANQDIRTTSLRLIDISNFFTNYNGTVAGVINGTSLDVDQEDRFMVKLLNGTEYVGNKSDVIVLSDGVPTSYFLSDGPEVDTEYSFNNNTFTISQIAYTLCLSCEQQDVLEIGAYVNEYNDTIFIGGYREELNQKFLIVDSLNITIYDEATLEEGDLTYNGTNGDNGQVGEGIAGAFLGIFPSASTLSFAEGIGISMLFMLMFFGAGVWLLTKTNSQGEETVLKIAMGLMVVLTFVFFTAIGYIPAWIIGVLAVAIIAFFIATIGKSVTGV